MTREQEIEQAIKENCLSSVSVIFFKMGAEWADAHQPQVAYLEHEIERLKSKLQAADDLNALLTAELEKAKSPWISVEDRLPKEEDPDDKGYSVSVIGLFSDGSVSKCFCSLEEGIWFIEGLTCDPPTHWMPIPEL